MGQEHLYHHELSGRGGIYSTKRGVLIYEAGGLSHKIPRLNVKSSLIPPVGTVLKNAYFELDNIGGYIRALRPYSGFHLATLSHFSHKPHIFNSLYDSNGAVTTKKEWVDDQKDYYVANVEITDGNWRGATVPHLFTYNFKPGLNNMTRITINMNADFLQYNFLTAIGALDDDIQLKYSEDVLDELKFALFRKHRNFIIKLWEGFISKVMTIEAFRSSYPTEAAQLMAV